MAVFFLVAFLASVVGAICGIAGLRGRMQKGES